MNTYFVIKRADGRFMKIRQNGKTRNWVKNLKGASVGTEAQMQARLDEIQREYRRLGREADADGCQLVKVGEAASAWQAKLEAVNKQSVEPLKWRNDAMKARLKSIGVKGIYDPKEPGGEPQMNTLAVGMEFCVGNKRIRHHVRLVLAVDLLAVRFEDTKEAKSEHLTQKFMEYARRGLEDGGTDTTDIDFTDVENVVRMKMPLLLRKVINYEYFIQEF